MLKKVFEQIDKANIKTGTKLLCAISGGVDSTVMLHVLDDFGFDCIVAHCNFQLRGKASDDDENFVRELAAKFEFKFLCQTFDTYKYAEKTGLSIQMAARDLRYNWFNEMAKQYNCKYIALAHNSDDQVETIISNLARGTGIKGLTGMSFVKDKLFRPLLFTSREEIEAFAEENAIDFKIDETNKSTKYSRNKIRHKIIPLLEEINTSAKSNILKSVKYLTDTEVIMREYVKSCKEKCLNYIGENIEIDLRELKKCVAPETVLFELLLGEGIPKPLASESINLIDSKSGKTCSFLNITVLRDRNSLIINKNSKIEKFETVFINNFDELKLLEQFKVSAKLVDYQPDLKINKISNFAYIDFEKLVFPLSLRTWQEGDRFKPFGMKNYRKLSDFLKDEKLNLFEKENLKILESDGKIVWLLGLRLDNRFRISDETKKVLILEKT